MSLIHYENGAVRPLRIMVLGIRASRPCRVGWKPMRNSFTSGSLIWTRLEVLVRSPFVPATRRLVGIHSDPSDLVSPFNRF